jgi:acetamidase/formamidase
MPVWKRKSTLRTATRFAPTGSVAADLHISELVDGNDVVSMMLPKAIFVSANAK